MKYFILIIMIILGNVNLFSQSKSYFIHKNPESQRESIYFLWEEDRKYTYTKVSKSITIEGGDTLKKTFEFDTISFQILKIKPNNLDIRVFLNNDKLSNYFINKNCKTDLAFDQISMIYVDLQYNFNDQTYTLIECDRIKTQCKEIINYNKNCVFDNKYEELWFNTVTEKIDSCSTLNNWFSYDLQFLFAYDRYSYPKHDSIRFTIKKENINQEPDDVDISEEEENLKNDLLRVNYILSKKEGQNGTKIFTLKEDTSFEPSMSTKIVNLFLEGMKKLMTEEEYEVRKKRIQTKVENGQEEIIISNKNELMGIRKTDQSTEYIDKLSKSKFHYSEIKRLE